MLERRMNDTNHNWGGWNGYHITYYRIPKGYAYAFYFSYKNKPYNLATIEVWDSQKKGAINCVGRAVKY
jgi:hypothetical protein